MIWGSSLVHPSFHLQLKARLPFSCISQVDILVAFHNTYTFLLIKKKKSTAGIKTLNIINRMFGTQEWE